MSFIFYCQGHPNIRGTHVNTIEFTREEEMTLKGDCIVGVKADFDPLKLKEFISNTRKCTVKMVIGRKSDSFHFISNRQFSDEKEIVIRRTDFLSSRTLGINASKAAKDIKREIVEEMKNEYCQMKVIIDEEKDIEQ